MSTGTSTSTDPRLIAPDTAAATGLATAAVIAPEAAGTTAVIVAGAAAGIADRPGHNRSRADSVSGSLRGTRLGYKHGRVVA
jgi:hypothetical protein